jgi:hypothetical protein
MNQNSRYTIDEKAIEQMNSFSVLERENFTKITLANQILRASGIECGDLLAGFYRLNEGDET